MLTPDPVPPHAAVEEETVHPKHCHCYDCEPTFSKRYINDIAPVASQAAPEMPEWVKARIHAARRARCIPQSDPHVIEWLADRVAELERRETVYKLRHDALLREKHECREQLSALQASAAQEDQVLEDARRLMPAYVTSWINNARYWRKGGDNPISWRDAMVFLADRVAELERELGKTQRPEGGHV